MLQSLNDTISLEEVIAIYLPLSRLPYLALCCGARPGAVSRHATLPDAHENERKFPYITASPGLVAVGKSTTARVFMALLAALANTPKVDLLTTERFSSAQCRAGNARELMERKGLFPEKL